MKMQKCVSRFAVRALSACCLWAALSPAVAADSAGLRPWDEYRVIMWVEGSAYRQPDKVPLFFQRLREMGVNTAMVYGADGNPRPLVENAFPYYVENIVNRGLCLKWSSKVRDWDKFVTAWARTRDEASLVREYVLDDPQWRDWAKSEMRAAARKHQANQPLAYDIRDELSVTISANPFDYDFSALTLKNFRDWLKTQYGDLAALNREWETQFPTWDDVKPFTTDQIKARMAGGEAIPRDKPDWQALQRLKFDPATARQSPTRWNFAPWADFRTYMDISLAAALDDLRQAAHAADPRTPAGIEGTQMPHAFGGYDLWRLSQVLDWVEPYDIGNSRDIFGSFMPGKTILTTVFEKDTNPARRRLWHLLLEGDRGCIIWWSQDCIDWKSDDYALTPKARALAPVLKELTSPLARIFLRAEKQHDPIAIHYSQPSVQVDWLLESTVDGPSWLRRFSSFEADHNRMVRVRNGWLKAFEDLGYSPRFVSSAQIAAGELKNCRVVVLPQSLALSAAEIQQLRPFCAKPGADRARWLFADARPGLFDEHGRLRRSSELQGLDWNLGEEESFDRTVLCAKPGEPRITFGTNGPAAFSQQRLRATATDDLAGWVESCLGQGGPNPMEVTVPRSSRTRIHRYTLGGARLVAFERNINYHMSEDLKQAGGNESLEQPIELEAKLAQPAHVYDLRSGKYVGRVDRLRFTLDPWQPALFALLAEPVPVETILETLLAGK